MNKSDEVWVCSVKMIVDHYKSNIPVIKHLKNRSLLDLLHRLTMGCHVLSHAYHMMCKFFEEWFLLISICCCLGL